MCLIMKIACISVLMQAMCCVRALPLLAPDVVPVHGIALHTGGSAAGATVVEVIAFVEVGADTIY